MRILITWTGVWITACAAASTTSAQVPPPAVLGSLTLMSNLSVAPEMKLTIEQQEKTKGIYQKHRQKSQSLIATVGDDLTKYQVDFFRIQAEGMTELATVLTQEQLKRLKQICWQQGGIHALAYDEELQTAIKMTPQQKDLIRKVADHHLATLREMMQSPPQGMIEKVAAMRKENVDKAVASLTAAQQKAYKDLLGTLVQVINGRRGGGG